MTHQTENGFTRIADSLLDALALADLSKRELKILLVVLRRTYGFGKKHAPLSASFIAQATGLQRQHIASAISAMVQRGILHREHTQHANLLGINKAWFPSPETVTVGSPETGTVASPKTGTPTVPKTGTPHVPKQVHKRETSIDTSIDTPLPLNVDRELWDEFVTHRKQKRSKLTPVAEKRALAMLAKQPDPNACITQTLEAGWTGLFPVKLNGARHGRTQGTGYNGRRTTADMVADADAAASAAEAAAGHGPIVAPDGCDLRRAALAEPCAGIPDAGMAANPWEPDDG